MKKRNISFIIIILILIVALIVISLNYFKKLKPYELSLPDINKIAKISVKFNESYTELTNDNDIEKIITLLNYTKKTYNKSTQGYPTKANNIIEIKFYIFEEDSTNYIYEESNIHYYKTITTYAYTKNDKYYLEQPYNGIYKITNKVYDNLKIKFNGTEKKVIEFVHNLLEKDFLNDKNIKMFEITKLSRFGYYQSKKDIHYIRVDFNMLCYDGSRNCIKIPKYRIDNETNTFYFFMKININTYDFAEIIDKVSGATHTNPDWVNADTIIK